MSRKHSRRNDLKEAPGQKKSKKKARLRFKLSSEGQPVTTRGGGHLKQNKWGGNDIQKNRPNQKKLETEESQQITQTTKIPIQTYKRAFQQLTMQNYPC